MNKHIPLLATVLIASFVLGLGLLSTSPSQTISENATELSQHIVDGGPPPDGIPPIEEPNYAPVESIDMEDEEPVFIYNTKEGTYIYSQRILVSHEIVNEEFDGEKVSVTYCPLTGSALAYNGTMNSVETTFGTSGKLVNSNLIMYDRETDSYIPQILGKGIQGELQGKQLELNPLTWSTWGDAKEVYPEAQVLTEDTGFARNYDLDPYGDYLSEGTYYDSGQPFFPVQHQDLSEEPKEVYIGIWGETPVGVKKEKVRQEKAVQIDTDEQALVALYDERLDAVRVFDREKDGETLDITYESGEGFVDDQGRTWSAEGESKDLSLDWVESFDVFWFAWHAFFPEADVYR